MSAPELRQAGEPGRVHVAVSLNSATRERMSGQLAAAGLEVTFTRDRDELVALLSEIEFLLIGRPPRLDWSAAGRLRLIHVAGSGVDPLFPALGLRPEVQVANCRGAHADAVRDHVFGSLLMFARDLPHAGQSQRERRWSPRPLPSLRGQKLCVVGLGEIGKRVAHTALAFGLDVIGVNYSGTPVEGVTRLHRADDLAGALVDADYVVLCIPLTQGTRHLFGGAVLERLPRHAVLISVARGGVIDEAALEARLRGGQLRGAVLDVFEHEPLPPSSSLWDCPGLVITPHVAGFTPDYFAAVTGMFIDAIARVRRGHAPLTHVSRDHEY